MESPAADVRFAATLRCQTTRGGRGERGASDGGAGRSGGPRTVASRGHVPAERRRPSTTAIGGGLTQVRGPGWQPGPPPRTTQGRPSGQKWNSNARTSMVSSRTAPSRPRRRPNGCVAAARRGDRGRRGARPGAGRGARPCRARGGDHRCDDVRRVVARGDGRPRGVRRRPGLLHHRRRRGPDGHHPGRHRHGGRPGAGGGDGRAPQGRGRHHEGRVELPQPNDMASVYGAEMWL